MDVIDFNKHDINIFIYESYDTWGRHRATLKLVGVLNFAFDQWESEVNLQKVTSLPESPSNVSPVKHIIADFYVW
jgi:hypothetical protein